VLVSMLPPAMLTLPVISPVFLKALTASPRITLLNERPRWRRQWSLLDRACVEARRNFVNARAEQNFRDFSDSERSKASQGRDDGIRQGVRKHGQRPLPGANIIVSC
jgi:hypothetical protein